MQQKRCLGELYLFLNEFLVGYCDEEQSISRKQIITIIGKFLHVKDYEQMVKIFHELIEYGYIVEHRKKLDGMYYKILG